MRADAAPLWRAAAKELADHAAEVTAAGGLEAAIEAPAIYASLDALAHRARRFEVRRCEQREQQGAGSGALAPEEVGARAEASVRAVFTAAVDVAKEGMVTAAQQRVQESLFPALAPAAPPVAAVASSSRPARPQQQPAGIAVEPGSNPGAAASAAPERAALSCSEPEANSPRASSPRAELHFDHAFSEDEEEEEQPRTGSGAAQPMSARPASSRAAPAAGVASLSGSSPMRGAQSGDGSEQLLGTSPATFQLNHASCPAGDFYTYQAADGQWLFLHPLNLRCLLHHCGGSYETCPRSVRAKLVEVEDVVQSEATRRRYKYLAHLPLTGVFRCVGCMHPPPPPGGGRGARGGRCPLQPAVRVRHVS